MMRPLTLTVIVALSTAGGCEATGYGGDAQSSNDDTHAHGGDAHSHGEAPHGDDHYEVTQAPVVAGLPVAACFELPVAGFKKDGCLEFLQKNPQFDNKRHAGDDYCVSSTSAAGKAVKAVGAGKVMYARSHGTCPNWGHLIAIEHKLSNGTSAVSIYGHVKPSVAEGAMVTKGQQIGGVASYSCWADHIHFAIASRDWGASVGTYPAWVTGYLAHSTVGSAPYTDPAPWIASRTNCPPTLSGHTYQLSGLTRTVTVTFHDPEGAAPLQRTIRYQYRDAVGTVKQATATMSLTSGAPGSGTYRWSGTVYGTQFKFALEFTDGGGHFVRYPATGFIE